VLDLDLIAVIFIGKAIKKIFVLVKVIFLIFVASSNRETLQSHLSLFGAAFLSKRVSMTLYQGIKVLKDRYCI